MKCFTAVLVGHIGCLCHWLEKSCGCLCAKVLCCGSLSDSCIYSWCTSLQACALGRGKVWASVQVINTYIANLSCSWLWSLQFHVIKRYFTNTANWRQIFLHIICHTNRNLFCFILFCFIKTPIIPGQPLSHVILRLVYSF